MTNPMTPARLKEIKARCEAATEGPWEQTYLEYMKIFSLFHSRHGEIGGIAPGRNADGGKSYEQHESNAQFIAHARQDLPDCLAEIERLKQELSLEKANAEMRRKEILLGVKEISRLIRALEAK